MTTDNALSWVAQVRAWQTTVPATPAMIESIEIVGVACDKIEQLERDLAAARAAVKAWEDKEANRGMCCWQMEQERDAARAEAARLRERWDALKRQLHPIRASSVLDMMAALEGHHE